MNKKRQGLQRRRRLSMPMDYSYGRNDPLGALAHLGLARAFVLQTTNSHLANRTHGEESSTDAEQRSENLIKAKKAYQDFFAIWNSADSDIPILRQARDEFRTLERE